MALWFKHWSTQEKRWATHNPRICSWTQICLLIFRYCILQVSYNIEPWTTRNSFGKLCTKVSFVINGFYWNNEIGVSLGISTLWFTIGL